MSVCVYWNVNLEEDASIVAQGAAMMGFNSGRNVYNNVRSPVGKDGTEITTANLRTKSAMFWSVFLPTRLNNV